MAGSVSTAETPDQETSRFIPFIELAPFEVNGEQLAISIHARTKADRRYARKFAEEVVGIAFGTMEKSTGHGLVIVGRKGEPHPVFVYRKFLAMADADELNPEVAELSPGLTHMLRDWEDGVDFDEGSGNGPDIDFEMVVNAIPLPLEGIGSNLYQMAWADDFDMERFGFRLNSLAPGDFERDELSRFDWVFYLPPKSAFSEALKDIVPTMIKKAELGFLQRMALRSALTIFKPLLKKAIEGARKGMLFLTVLRAMSDFTEEEVESLTGIYIEALMPFGGDGKHDSPLAAIEAQKAKNTEYARNPFVAPDPLEDVDLEIFARFEGEYSRRKRTTHRFAIKDGTCIWQYLNRDPVVFLPAGDSLFVSVDGERTIEFLVTESGDVAAVEERSVGRNKTIPRKP